MANRRVKELFQLGGHIREERKAQGLSQTELAEIAGVSLNFVSQLESGKERVQINKVFIVMRALGLEFNVVYTSKNTKGKKQ